MAQAHGGMHDRMVAWAGVPRPGPKERNDVETAVKSDFMSKSEYFVKTRPLLGAPSGGPSRGSRLRRIDE